MTEDVVRSAKPAACLPPTNETGGGAEICQLITERLAAAAKAFEAMSPVDKALVASDQRRSFVRGQCGIDPGPDVMAEEVRRQHAEIERLSAHRDRLEHNHRTLMDIAHEHINELEADMARAIQLLEDPNGLREAAAISIGGARNRLLAEADAVEHLTSKYRTLTGKTDDRSATTEGRRVSPENTGDAA